MIHVDLSVKFRAFGITFGTVVEHFDPHLPFPVPVPIPNDVTLISYHDHGINLVVILKATV